MKLRNSSPSVHRFRADAIIDKYKIYTLALFKRLCNKSSSQWKFQNSERLSQYKVIVHDEPLSLSFTFSTVVKNLLYASMYYQGESNISLVSKSCNHFPTAYFQIVTCCRQLLCEHDYPICISVLLSISFKCLLARNIVDNSSHFDEFQPMWCAPCNNQLIKRGPMRFHQIASSYRVTKGGHIRRCQTLSQSGT